MSHPLCDDILAQYQHTFRILYDEIGRFNEEQWTKGLDAFLTPVNVAMHIFDCLDFYFAGEKGTDYTWGHRFGGGWWELPPEKLPTQEDILAYAHELEERITAYLATLTGDALAQPCPQDSNVNTNLGHLIYAVRHTVHHHGELAALNVFHGNPGGSWH